MDVPRLELICLFQKGILSRACGCKHARRGSKGTRQTVKCQAIEGHEQCLSVLNHIRQCANFALGTTHTPSALPHDQAVRLQIGGLAGLQYALDPVATDRRVGDVYGLLQRALRRYGSLQDLPAQDIVKGIASHGK